METGLVPAQCSSVALPPEEKNANTVSLALRPVRVIEILNPFQPTDNKITEIEYLENQSIAAAAVGAGVKIEAYKISLNGEPVPDDEIWRTVVSPGCEILLFPRAAGGGWWHSIVGAILGMILIGVLLFFCPVILAAGGWIVGALFATGAAAGSLLMSWALAPGQPSPATYSSTYDPTGPKGLAQPGTPVPKGYGIMGWCGNVISSYVSYAGQKAYINVLVCYGFGKASAISSVKINNQPISNFADCSYQTRLGTNNQTAIDGFDSTVNGYPQETDLLVANGPVVVSGTGTNIQGLQVTMKFPSGLYSITGDGNYVNCHFIYKIEVSPHNQNSWTSPLFPNMANMSTVATFHNGGSIETWPAWVVVPTDQFAGSGLVYASDNGNHTPGDPWSSNESVTITNLDGSTGSTSHTFQGVWQPCDPNTNPVLCNGWWQGYVDVSACSTSAIYDTQCIYGLAPGQWDTRVTKIGWYQDRHGINFYDSTVANQICDGWLWNINELFWSNLTYPNMILIGIKALATSQLSGAGIQVMATITHDIGQDTILPAALAGFEHDNPAIVDYDVLTNPLYGAGCLLANVDVPAYVAWAELNDELVTNQDRSLVRRHIFAGVFDQTGDAWKTHQTIGNMSRAVVIPIGNRYTVILDAPADPVQLFTVGNTKKDSFQEMWVALDDRATLIECDFADAARNYRTDLPVSVMTAADMNSGLQPKTTRTKLVGCTSRDQAWRWCYHQLMSNKLALRSAQITAALESVSCRNGSVIAIQSDVVNWANGGRIQAGSTLTALNVERTDLTFAMASGWTVSVQHPIVQRGTAQIASISGLTLNLSAPVPSGRIVKAVTPDGTEYIVTGYGGSAVTLATATGLASSVPLAVGQVVTLYDVNTIENLSVSGVAITAPSSNGPGGAVISVSGAFSAVPSTDSAWAYGQSAGYQAAKLFRVAGIKRSGDFSFDIGAVEYNSALYTDVIPNYGEIVGVPNSTPAILNLSLTEKAQSGSPSTSPNSSVISVGWVNGNTAVGGQVKVQASGGAWDTIGNIQGQSCTFTGYVGTTYNVTVTGIDWQGNLLGTPVTASITVVASTNAPASVTGLTCAASGSTLVFNWGAVAGADHYEIRYQDSQAYYPWNTATVLWDGTGTTWTDSTIRTGMYMIVAVGSLASGGLQSIVPTYITPYPYPPIVTISQSATNTSGSGGSASASDGITVTASGGLTTAAKVWLTITWTWPSNYPTPTGFNVVCFTGSDPTVVANYLFDMIAVGPAARSCTVAVTPTSAMSVVNAAVEAVYA